MRWRIYLLVFCSIILVSVPAVAETLTMNVNPEWIVANGHDSAIIDVLVTEGGSNATGRLVQFSVNDSALGSISPGSAVTDGTGRVKTTFTSKTKSGNATVTARVNLSQTTGLVKIDHDIPYSIGYLAYPNEETVGSIQPITVRMQDIHGNIIDDRKDPEYVSFQLITDGDTSRLQNTTTRNYTETKYSYRNTVDGTVLANLTLATDPGNTLVLIEPPSTISSRRILIIRVADGDPYRMEMKRDPSVPYVPADGNSTFTFTYFLYDEYGNGLSNKMIRLNSSNTDHPWGPLLVTTVTGKAAVTYGPSDTSYSAEIMAVAEGFEWVNESLTVEFYDDTADNLLLTINPITMPSGDVPGAEGAFVSASVVDMYGKPVDGENVTFYLGEARYPASYVINQTPYLENVCQTSYMAVTEGGYATAKFFPAAFTRNISDELYDDMATGEIDVFANWNGVTRHVTPIWKNYPYLTISTYVDDPFISVNETINVSISVRGDGFALMPKPIDLILTTNRGSSMLGDMYWEGDSGAWEDKMVYLHSNAQFLLSYLNESYLDRAGIVSFGTKGVTGYPDKTPGDDGTNKDDEDDIYAAGHYDSTTPAYPGWSTTDHVLDEHIDLVEQDVWKLNPYGPKKNNVPMRDGIYRSIQELTGHGNSTYRRGSIKAIVLLSDSDWNDYGDPLAGWDGSSVATSLGYFEEEKDPTSFPESGRSQWTAFHSFDNETNVDKSDPRQNLANYAKKNNIIVFPVAYFKKGVSIPTALDNRFQAFAAETGGVYYKADSGEALKAIFEDIGRRLRQEAGVNTTATLNFTQVKVNEVIYSGNQTFDYIYQNGSSTQIVKWNQSRPLENPIYNYTEDQTTDWITDLKLVFNIGTMYLGDNWRANFTLKSKKEGTVEFFGEGSEVTFNEGEDVTLPELFQYSQPIRFGDLPTQDLKVPDFGVDPDTLRVWYTINYTGDQPVHVKISYKKLGDITQSYRQFSAKTFTCGEGCQNIQGEAYLNKRGLTIGSYSIKIEAIAADTDGVDNYKVLILESDAPMGVNTTLQRITDLFRILLR